MDLFGDWEVNKLTISSTVPKILRNLMFNYKLLLSEEKVRCFFFQFCFFFSIF